jgi:poly(A) polymerase Pap1
LAFEIYSLDTDIDVLFIAQNFVTGERFFSEFVVVLHLNQNVRSIEIISGA